MNHMLIIIYLLQKLDEVKTFANRGRDWKEERDQNKSRSEMNVFPQNGFIVACGRGC